MNKTGKPHIVTIIAIIAAVIVLAFALLWFRNSIDDFIELNTGTYLSENVRAASEVFNTKLTDQMIMLESQERYFINTSLTDYNAMKKTIMATKGIGAFKTIGVANRSGTTINYNGRSSGNILLTDYFKEAIEGNNAISESTVIDEEGEEVLVLAIPITQHGAVAGVVFGTFGKKELGALVESVSFAQSGTNILAANDGTILARSQNFELIPENSTNLFDLIPQETIDNDNDRMIPVKCEGGEAVAVVTNIGDHGWYFTSFLPESAISSQTETISGYVVIVMFAVAGAFIILFLSIIYLIKRNEAIARSNERFKLAASESQDIIFDYDYSKRVLSVDGNISNLVEYQKNTLTREETVAFFVNIHQEDIGIAQELAQIAHNDLTSVNKEFRIRCLDGNYSWFRLKATVVRANDGHPTQVVGSLSNVDEQMNKEFLLIEKAEHDQLTGLFNSVAFSDRVKALLSDATNKDLYALYVINIDNFRAVNDSLGHTTGDQVLADIAKKLCLVFNELDFVGRTGGDEFAVMLRLSETGRKIGLPIIETKASIICEQLRDTYRTRKREVNISASVGVAVFPLIGVTYEALYDNASAALQSVKNNGKDGFSIVPALMSSSNE